MHVGKATFVLDRCLSNVFMCLYILVNTCRLRIGVNTCRLRIGVQADDQQAIVKES